MKPKEAIEDKDNYVNCQLSLPLTDTMYRFRTIALGSKGMMKKKVNELELGDVCYRRESVGEMRVHWINVALFPG